MTGNSNIWGEGEIVEVSIQFELGFCDAAGSNYLCAILLFVRKALG